MSTSYTILMRPWHEEYTLKNSPDLTSVMSQEQVIARMHSNAVATLRGELIDAIMAQTPAFFEQLIIDLMLALGYGGRRRDVARWLGRSGDGGIDGVISEDSLGLDLIYLQAKRYNPCTPVPVSEVRDFIGALQSQHAGKGVFVTTSRFTRAARVIVDRISSRISLIDQTRLADLMIRHNLGVRVKQSYQFKALDDDYFSPATLRIRWRDTPLVPRAQ